MENKQDKSENNQIIRFIDEHFAGKIKKILEIREHLRKDEEKTKEQLLEAIEHTLNLLKQI